MSLWHDAFETHLASTRLIQNVVESGRLGPDNTAGLLVDRYLMREATPYAWNTEILHAVTHASLNVPTETLLTRWTLDTDAVWWYFQDPLPLKTLKNDDRGVRALSAGWIQKRIKGGEAYRIPAGSPTTMVEAAMQGARNVFAVGCWIDYYSHEVKADRRIAPPNTLAPTLLFEWWEGETLEQMHQRVYGDDGNTNWAQNFQGTEVLPTSNACVFLARLFLAGLTWMDQKILVEGAGQIHRQRRKEFEQVTGRKLPWVKIVTLRKVQRPSTSSSASHESSVEFSCRWIVDGHWRNARVGPGRQERRLVYVHPYVKGPEDKPLVARAKVYKVTR